MKVYKTIESAQRDAYRNDTTHVDVSSKFDFDAMLEINRDPHSNKLVYYLNSRQERKKLTNHEARKLIEG